LGRFTQPDTIIPDLGNPQSYNRYAYCLNNPLKYVDPDGRAVIQAWQAAQENLINAGGFFNNAGAYGISLGITAMNAFSLGSFGKNDALADRAIAGEISDAQFYGGIAVNGGVAAASVAAGGGAGGLVVKAAGTGLGASVGAGAAAGFAASTTDVLGTRAGYGALGVEYQQSVGQDLAQIGLGTAGGAVAGGAVRGLNQLAKPLHGNNLNTTKPAQGYSLRDRDTGRLLKYGETTRGPKRYSQKYLEKNNAEMVFETKGSKRQMHQWQHQKILDHKAANSGERPPLNKSDY
jgi:hypothetical protein